MKYWPPYGATDPDAGWVNGNPAIGSRGSIIDCRAIEQAQREIVNTISDAGLVTSDADLHQLARAIQSGGLTYADDTGTSGSIVVTLSPPPAAYVKGIRFSTQLAYDIPGATVCNVNGLGAKSVINSDGSALTLGQFKAGAMLCLEYDGTALQVVSGGTTATQKSLTSNIDIYVNPVTGSDNYDGTAPLVGGGHGPFSTLTKALAVVGSFAPSTYRATIHLSAGTFDSGAAGFKTVYWAHCPVTVDGEGAATVIQGSASAILGIVGPHDYRIGDFKVQSSSSYVGGASCIYGAGGALIEMIGEITFGGSTAPISHFVYCAQGAIKCSGAIKLSGNPGYSGAYGTFFAASGAGAGIDLVGTVITATTVVTCGYFTSGYNLGSVRVNGNWPATFVNPGNVTGSKYLVNINGTIDTQGRGVNYFPGSSAGVVAGGGQYN